MNFRPMTIATRVTEEHAKLITKAAELQKMTVTDYVRRFLVPWAASDCGEPSPDLTVYTSRDMVADAAALSGLTVSEFKSQAATRMAQDLLRAQLPEPVSYKANEMRKAPEKVRSSAISGLRRAVGTR